MRKIPARSYLEKDMVVVMKHIVTTNLISGYM